MRMVPTTGLVASDIRFSGDVGGREQEGRISGSLFAVFSFGVQAERRGFFRQPAADIDEQRTDFVNRGCAVVGNRLRQDVVVALVVVVPSLAAGAVFDQHSQLERAEQEQVTMKQLGGFYRLAANQQLWPSAQPADRHLAATDEH